MAVNYKPSRTFTGSEGQKTTGLNGPEPIKADLTNLFKKFDPTATLNDGETPGGVHESNLRDDAASDRVIGNRILVPTNTNISNTGQLLQLLNWFSYQLGQVMGTDWKEAVPKSLKDKVTFSTNDVKYVRLNADKVIETSGDGSTWEASGSSGHIIVDGAGNVLTQRSRLQFLNTTITDEGGITKIVALQGVKGDTGAQGPKGDTGETGAQGLKGDRGYLALPSVTSQGVLSWSLSDQTALPNPINLRGPQGVQGVQGIQGPQGPAGETGAQGPAGPQGLRGDDGADGRSFVVKSLYATLLTLQTAHPTGTDGDAYAVGTTTNNTIYIWDVDNTQWTQIGPMQGPQGAQGIQGVQGPQGVQGIQGPQGIAGTDGIDGKTAYEAAVDGGFVGTEAEFNEALADIEDKVPASGGTMTGDLIVPAIHWGKHNTLEIPENNCNSITESGFYSGLQPANAPIAGGGIWWFIEHIQHYDEPNLTHWSRQVAYRYEQTHEVFTRISIYGDGGVRTWSAWFPIGVPDGGILPSNCNLNNVTKTGSYWLGDAANMLNIPPDCMDIGSWGLLTVDNSQNSYIVQTYRGILFPQDIFTRVRTETTWSPWIGIPTAKGKVSVATDFNILTAPGTYDIATVNWDGWLNVPANAGRSAYTWGSLEVTTSGGVITQVYYPHQQAPGSVGPYHRVCYGTTWTAWGYNPGTTETIYRKDIGDGAFDFNVTDLPIAGYAPADIYNYPMVVCIHNNASVTVTNGPPGETGGTLFTFETSHSGWMQQIFIGQGGDVNTPGAFWYRRSIDDGGTRVWQAWEKAITTGNMAGLEATFSKIHWGTNNTLPVPSNNPDLITESGFYAGDLGAGGHAPDGNNAAGQWWYIEHIEHTVSHSFGVQKAYHYYTNKHYIRIGTDSEGTRVWGAWTQVVTTDAGGGVKLAEVTLADDNSYYVNLSNIPAGYRYLELEFDLKCTNTALTQVNVTINDVNTNTYFHRLVIDGALSTVTADTLNMPYAAGIGSQDSYSYGSLRILNRPGCNKPFNMHYISGDGNYLVEGGGLFTGTTNEVTKLGVSITSSYSFKAGSHLILRGYK